MSGLNMIYISYFSVDCFCMKAALTWKKGWGCHLVTAFPKFWMLFVLFVLNTDGTFSLQLM